MRLIDADVLKGKVLEWMPSDPCGIEGKEYPLETDIVASLMMEIEEAPTIEPSWIPCSEQLPRYDETSEYLVTDKAGRVRHCLLDPYMPDTFVTVEEGMIVDAVAWRPAPEPWRGGENE